MTRLGLTQRVDVVDAYGERRDCLDQAWTTLLASLDCTPIPLPNRIDDVDGYLDALALDGLVLTSGNDLAALDDASNPAPERDAFEAAALEYAIRHELPTLAVCRGVEFLNVHLGGSLREVSDHVACTHPVAVSTQPSGVAIADQFSVNSYHDYGIDASDVAPALRIHATAPDGSVEFVSHESLPIWGIMWHPERESPSAAIDRQIIEHAFTEDPQ